MEQETEMIDPKKQSDYKQSSVYDPANKMKISPNRITNSSSKNQQILIQEVDRITVRDNQKSKQDQNGTMLKSSQFQTRFDESHDDQPPLIEYNKGSSNKVVLLTSKNTRGLDLPLSNPEDLQSYVKQNTQQRNRVI